MNNIPIFFLVIIGALLVAICPSAQADETSSANRLVVEVVKLLNQAKIEHDPSRQLELATEAEEKLNKLIERYPGSDAAVKLVTGQSIGTLSLEHVANQKERYGSLFNSARAKECFAAPNRECIWVQALATVKEIDPSGLQFQALADIAFAQAKSGDVEQAQETIDEGLVAARQVGNARARLHEAAEPFQVGAREVRLEQSSLGKPPGNAALASRLSRGRGDAPQRSG